MTSKQKAPIEVTKARNANLIIFGVMGVLIASWLSRLPDIKHLMNLNTGALSVLLLAVAVGSLAGLPVAGRIADRFGSKWSVRIGAAVCLSGLLVATFAIQFGLGFAPAFIGLLVLGFGVGVWDVAQNLEGTVIERRLGKSIMPWFHAAFSGGTVLGALIGAIATNQQFPLAAHIVLAVLATIVLLAWSTSNYLPDDHDAAVETEANQPEVVKPISAWREPRTLLVGLMVLAAAFTEGTANDWTALAFVEGHGLSKTMGVIGLATFLAFMTAGRIFGTKAIDTYGRVTTLRILFALAVAGCLLMVFGGQWALTLVRRFGALASSLGFPGGNVLGIR